ncbi:GntR family transcriptional regulator [Methylocapsa sp. S129]|uniref:GntR family transcriptional regulator n=1 Tax=Methylocapsa sp. S129 TaxID=1641869 RepID=UPI00131C1955|nr:GntR family transcriptional regulator [Methylocapsa sp. S129]
MANAGSVGDPPLERLTRPRSLTEMVITEIRELIVSGRLVLGEQLSESALAEQLGVSRTPVREAFLRLETERLVEVRPQRGTFVFQYGAPELRDICELREVLETGALRIALSRNRVELIERLEGETNAADAAGVVEPGPYQAFDKSFHDALVRASANEELIEAYERISGRVRTIRYRLTRSRRQIAGSQRGHREIVNALKDGRDADAIRRLGKHVYNAYEMFRREIEATRMGHDASAEAGRNDKAEAVGRGAAQ